MKLIKKSNLLKNILEFNDKARLGAKANKKKNTYENLYSVYEVRDLVSNIYKRWLFPWESTQGKEIRILTRK